MLLKKDRKWLLLKMMWLEDLTNRIILKNRFEGDEGGKQAFVHISEGTVV